jgi:hypothetical protein
MSHVLEVLVPAIPGDDRLAWIALAAVRATQPAGPKAGALVRLHDILVSVYPCMSHCLSHCLPGDPAIDECPWSDGWLIDRVGSRMASLHVRADRLDKVLGFVVAIAGLLGLSVFDKQRGEIHRPPAPAPATTYQIHIHGVRPGFGKDAVVARIARVFRQEPARVRAMLDTPRTTVRRHSEHLDALRCQAMLTKLGCCCSLVPEQSGLPPLPEISLAGGNRAAELLRLRRCAQLGHPDSAYQLGYLLLNGLDLAQDSIQGVAWIEQAAAQGHCDAQWTLALCYREGNGVFKSYARTLEWMRKAALQGDAQAQTSVGRIYCKGEGVQPDLAEARRWFQLAAAQGDSQGQYLLGKMLAEGKGGPVDRDRANALFVRASQLGNLDARLRLQAAPAQVAMPVPVPVPVHREAAVQAM